MDVKIQYFDPPSNRIIKSKSYRSGTYEIRRFYFSDNGLIQSRIVYQNGKQHGNQKFYHHPKYHRDISALRISERFNCYCGTVHGLSEKYELSRMTLIKTNMVEGVHHGIQEHIPLETLNLVKDKNHNQSLFRYYLYDRSVSSKEFNFHVEIIQGVLNLIAIKELRMMVLDFVVTSKS